MFRGLCPGQSHPELFMARCAGCSALLTAENKKGKGEASRTAVFQKGEELDFNFHLIERMMSHRTWLHR